MHYRGAWLSYLCLIASALTFSTGPANGQDCTNNSGTSTIVCTGGPGASVVISSSNSFTRPHTVTANNFPATVTVSGAPTGVTVATVAVTLVGYTSVAPLAGESSADVGILLSDPNGKNLQILRCAGTGNSSQPGSTVVIADGDFNSVTNSGLVPSCASVDGASDGTWDLTSGSTTVWKPSTYDDTGRDSEQSPSYGFAIQFTAADLGGQSGAPAAGTLNGVFEGEPVNGTWPTTGSLRPE